jgi:t-SNARE complex subunit (syntaxin)
MEEVIETRSIVKIHAERIEELERSVIQLQDSMHIIYELVEGHGEHISTIEEYMDESKQYTLKANEEFEEAVRHDSAVTYYLSSVVAVIAIIGFMII